MKAIKINQMKAFENSKLDITIPAMFRRRKFPRDCDKKTFDASQTMENYEGQILNSSFLNSLFTATKTQHTAQDNLY